MQYRRVERDIYPVEYGLVGAGWINLVFLVGVYEAVIQICSVRSLPHGLVGIVKMAREAASSPEDGDPASVSTNDDRGAVRGLDWIDRGSMDTVR